MYRGGRHGDADFGIGGGLMGQTLAIAVGGALGALFRFWVSSGLHSLLGRDFPYGTLAVNVLGSLSIGAASVLFLERLAVAPEVRMLVLVGMLGAFTTFSTFSLETINLLQSGRLFTAGANVVLNVMLCVTATWLGLMLARQL